MAEGRPIATLVLVATIASALRVSSSDSRMSLLAATVEPNTPIVPLEWKPRPPVKCSGLIASAIVT